MTIWIIIIVLLIITLISSLYLDRKSSKSEVNKKPSNIGKILSSIFGYILAGFIIGPFFGMLVVPFIRPGMDDIGKAVVIGYALILAFIIGQNTPKIWHD